MSDQATPRRGGQAGAKPRKRGSRVPPAKVAAPAAAAVGAATLSPRAAAYRARRGTGGTTAKVSHISRELELAYIRADMRRLIYIAGGLLILMFLILLVVNR